jgi:hypothetical protein
MTTDIDPTDELGRVGQEEAKRLLGLLDEAIVKSRRSRREIERKLGWSQGYLGSLLRGRIGLKVWHVFALSRELGLEPLSFFLPVARPRDPNWILMYLGIPIPPEPKEPPPPRPPQPPMDRDELELLVKTLLHDELERAGLLDLYREPYSEDNFDQDLELEPAHSK